MTGGSGRRNLAFVGVCCCIAVWPGRATAQDGSPTLTVADGDVTFVTGDDGVSTLAVTLAVSDVTDPVAVSIVVDGADTGACLPLQQAIVRPGVATDVEFRLPRGCELAEPVTVEFVAAPFDASSATPTGVRLEASVEEAASSPEYVNLAWGFGIGAGVSVVAVFVAWFVRIGADPPPGQFGRWSRDPWQHLAGLDKKWTWSDSPLSSITVLAALFTAVFGASDPLETILGESGKRQTAVVVIAAALAAALTAAAPLAMALLRDEPGFYTEAEDAILNNYTVLGVMVATAAVMTGSLGLILTVVLTLWDSSAINELVLVVGAAVVGALVLAYTVRSMRRTLKIGTAERTVLNATAMP